MSGTMRLHGFAGTEEGLEQAALDSGSTVLLLSSCLDPAGREACRELLTVRPSARLNVIYVAFTRAGKHHLDWWTDAAVEPQRVAVIDAAPVPSRSAPIESDCAVYDRIGSPGNLTKIGVAISEHCKEFEGEGTTVVCLRSLTALLQYIELDRAYRFLNAIANQLASIGAIGHCHINPNAHSRQELNALRTVFDATVSIDRPDGPGH